MKYILAGMVLVPLMYWLGTLTGKRIKAKREMSRHDAGSVNGKGT